MKDAPCKNCEERHAECHPNCSDYQNYLEACKQEKDTIRRNRYKEQNVTGFRLDNIVKTLKARGSR